VHCDHQKEEAYRYLRAQERKIFWRQEEAVVVAEYREVEEEYFLVGPARSFHCVLEVVASKRVVAVLLHSSKTRFSIAAPEAKFFSWDLDRVVNLN
jgi:hypothetical protein